MKDEREAPGSQKSPPKIVNPCNQDGFFPETAACPGEVQTPLSYHLRKYQKNTPQAINFNEKIW
jgi:hypothetical protein